MKAGKWLFVVLSVAGLIGVRALEDHIFYDPLIDYFHKVGLQLEFPPLKWGKLILHHILRFLLNLVFSALTIHFIFKNRRWTLQATILMVIFFLISFPVYLYCLSTEFEVGYVFSFYIRRFVIQPLILLLIIPMFYYRKQTERRN